MYFSKKAHLTAFVFWLSDCAIVFLQRLVDTHGEDCVVALEFRFALD